MHTEIIDLVLTAIVLAAFIGGVQRGVTALLIIRPLCDRLFEQARFDVAGHDLSYGAVLNFIVIIAMLLNLQNISDTSRMKLERAWIPFLLVALVAVFYSPVQVDAFRKFLTYVSYMAMFVLPLAIVRTQATAIYFSKVIILSSVLPVLYGLFQLASGMDWYQGSRIASTFTHPNIFAFYLLTTVAIIFSLLASSHVTLSDKSRRLLALYLVPLLALLIMTKTRSAWAGCLLLLLVYGTVQDRRVLVLTLALPILALALPPVRDRLVALGSGNEYVGWVQNVNPYAWRKILWQKALPLILQRPVFGYGLYSFPYYSPSFFPLESSRGVDAHNIYIQLLFETGCMGLATYLWIFWRKFSFLFRYWAFDRRGVTMVAAMASVYLIIGYSDNLLEYVSYCWCFWFALGLICAHLSHYRLVSSVARRKTVRGPAGRVAYVQGA
ncbi:MAG TPA: O-antigen ligase family protein [Rhizomicrobium sp.]|nr:O-antigen ligase family protein [Rhizomicrobium sp.]